MELIFDSPSWWQQRQGEQSCSQYACRCYLFSPPPSLPCSSPPPILPDFQESSGYCSLAKSSCSPLLQGKLYFPRFIIILCPVSPQASGSCELPKSGIQLFLLLMSTHKSQVCGGRGVDVWELQAMFSAFSHLKMHPSSGITATNSRQEYGTSSFGDSSPFSQG